LIAQGKILKRRGRRETYRELPLRYKLSWLNFIDVAPHPGFSRLDGTDKRMLALMEMFSGVFILRRIATAHMAAGETQAQVDPGIAGLHAFLADPLVGLFDFDLLEVRAFFCHWTPSVNLYIDTSL
jgi:hypothetical protein